jgi:hypothetical protein
MTKRKSNTGARLLPIKQYRQLKVKAAYHSYQLNQNPRTPIGEIQLKGKWLIEAGFGIDTPVMVRVMEGCLVVTTKDSGYDVQGITNTGGAGSTGTVK